MKCPIIFSRKVKQKLTEHDLVSKTLQIKIQEIEELTMNGDDEWFLDIRKKGDKVECNGVLDGNLIRDT